MSSNVEVVFPNLNFRLDLNERRAMGYVARAMAKDHKKALRRGKDSTGRSIKRPENGRALRKSGELIKSIKGYASKKRGRYFALVGATGTRPDLGDSLRGRNAALLGVQIYGKRNWSDRPRNPTLMKLSRSLERIAEEAFNKFLDSEFARGRASILGGTRITGSGLFR